MAKTLRKKCVSREVRKMVSNLEDLAEICHTLDTCYERPKIYMKEALKPIVEFRKYKMADNATIRELIPE